MLRPTLASACRASTGRCCVQFDAPAAKIERGNGMPHLEIALPWLDGEPAEWLLESAGEPATAEDCTVFRSADQIAGFTVADAAVDLEAATRDAYRRVFAVTRDWHLHRVWNYVPQINVVAAGLENYRRFCRGRSVAFEQEFGAGFSRTLPAASGVGTGAGPLAIAFLAGTAAPRHFENPQQVPAFEYPSDYGPRPPSFSRATRVEIGDRTHVYLSGTAAIRGHATIAPDDLDGQLACTCENLALIAMTAGAGPDVGARDGWQRTFKIYLRKRADLPRVRAHLARHLLRSSDRVAWLQADLCRRELRVEIEAVLSR